MNASTTAAPSQSTPSLADRVDRVAWGEVFDELDDVGIAGTGPVLTIAECRSIIGLYDQDERFRSTIDIRWRRFSRHKGFRGP